MSFISALWTRDICICRCAPDVKKPDYENQRFDDRIVSPNTRALALTADGCFVERGKYRRTNDLVADVF
jgi:hypothetical protein